VSSSSLRILRVPGVGVSWEVVLVCMGERESPVTTYEVKMRFLASWRAVALIGRVVVVDRWRRAEVGFARVEYRRAVLATIVGLLVLVSLSEVGGGDMSFSVDVGMFRSLLGLWCVGGLARPHVDFVDGSLPSYGNFTLHQYR